MSKRVAKHAQCAKRDPLRLFLCTRVSFIGLLRIYTSLNELLSMLSLRKRDMSLFVYVVLFW